MLMAAMISQFCSPTALKEWVILLGMKYWSMQEKQTLLHLN